MSKMRFYRDRLYVFAGKRFDTRSHITVDYEAVVLGRFVGTRADKQDCRGEYKPDDRIYRVEDGHLPDYQPRVHGSDLAREMLANLYPTACPVGT